MNPPPLDFGYPWYDVIEGPGPWEIVAPNNEHGFVLEGFRFPGAPDCLLIHQHRWILLNTLSDTEAIITHKYWEHVGYTWRLCLELIPAATASRFLFSKTKADKSSRVLTLNGLITECTAAVDQEALAIDLALLDATGSSVQKLQASVLHKNYGKLVALGQKLLEIRHESNLPNRPAPSEKEALVTQRVATHLASGYAVSDTGQLLVRQWKLYRQTP